MKRKIKIYSLIGFFIIFLIAFYFQYFEQINQIHWFIIFKDATKFDSIGFEGIFYFLIPILIILILEIVILDFKHSTLNRLIFKRTNSTKTDIINFFLSSSGLYDFLGAIFSFGIFYLGSVILYKCIGKHSTLNLIDSALLKFIIILILTDFKSFLWHYFMHLNPFWELHKFHHSATEFNIITTTRGHFFEKGFLTLFDSLLFLIVGAAPETFAFYFFFKEYYNYMLHCDLPWNFGWIGRHILVSPMAHKIHHSEDERHFNKNYGNLFVWWDKLFGTYLNTNETIKIGVKNSGLNEKGFWYDQYQTSLDFIKKCFSFLK